MKCLVIERWPVWLKSIFIDTNTTLKNYSHETKLSASTRRDDVKTVTCLPESFENTKLDFAQRALAVQKLQMVLNDITNDYDVIVFTHGISVNEIETHDDIAFTKEVMSLEDIQKAYQVTPSIEETKNNDDKTDKIKSDREEPTDRKNEENTLDAINVSNISDVKPIVNDDDDDMPVWLQQARGPKDEENCNTTNHVFDICTRFIAENNVVVDMMGIFPPEVLQNLASQRVFVPSFSKKSVVFIGGTKHVPQVGNWTVQLDSFNNKTFEYNVVESKIKVQKITRITRSVSSRGRVSRLNSLKKMRR